MNLNNFGQVWMLAVKQLFIPFMKNRVIVNDRCIKPLNQINQEVFLYNTKILCASISMNVNNYYSPPVDFYIQGGQSTMAHSNRNIRTRNGNSS